MEAPMRMRMRRDFEALDRTEVAEAMAEAMEWGRVAAEAKAGREKYVGVRKVPSGKYAAMITDPETGLPLWLGTYKAPVVAACAYDLKARSLRGNKARLNFAYPPPPCLVSAVAATPRRRRHSYGAPPAPPAPTPATFGAVLALKAPAVSAPASFKAYPYPHEPRAARARIVLPVPADTDITVVHSIPPASFSFQAAAGASRPIYDPMNLYVPPMTWSSAKSCFSSTADHKIRDSASSSSSRPQPLMLVKPEVIAVPTTATTPTDAGCEFTGDNFTKVPMPWDLNL